MQESRFTHKGYTNYRDKPGMTKYGIIQVDLL